MPATNRRGEFLKGGGPCHDNGIQRRDGVVGLCQLLANPLNLAAQSWFALYYLSRCGMRLGRQAPLHLATQSCSDSCACTCRCAHVSHEAMPPGRMREGCASGCYAVVAPALLEAPSYCSLCSTTERDSKLRLRGLVGQLASK